LKEEIFPKLPFQFLFIQINKNPANYLAQAISYQ